MTVIRKREGDKGGCCSPYSELQLEIERVDQTAIDAKTTANDTEAYLNTINGKVNEAIAVVPQVETNTENIAQHENRINANTTDINKNKIDIQEQGKDIAALKTKTNDNAAAIEALENEVGPETIAGTIQYRLKDIDTKLPTAIKEVEMIADASTVTHKATHISGTAESDALPVVSREQAGIMSASVYAAMEDVIANNTSRISVLEQSAPTYDISGLVGPNPTNAEISAAFTQKYPNIPIQAGLRAADYDNAHFWQYGKGTWILLTQIDVQIATNQSLGVVKGSSTAGKVFVEADGSMSLKGYDALVSKDATHDSKISTLETGLGDANARIDAANANVAKNATDIATANGNISANANDINGLKSRMATAEGQIATHETKINQHTQSINGLTTDVNGLKGRITTAEGQIATHETKIDQQTQSIDNLLTDVNALESSKQDKLIAGPGITIENDGKTISSSVGQWMNHTSENIDDIMEFQIYNYLEVTGNNSAKITVHKDLKFCIYIAHGPKSKANSLTYNELELPKGVYQINYDTTGLILMDNTGNKYSSTFIRLTRVYISISKYSNHNELKIGIGYEYNNGTTNASSGEQITLSNNNPDANAIHPIRVLPDVINAKTIATAVGISNENYSNKDIISGILIKYYEEM